MPQPHQSTTKTQPHQNTPKPRSSAGKLLLLLALLVLLAASAAPASGARTLHPVAAPKQNAARAGYQAIAHLHQGQAAAATAENSIRQQEGPCGVPEGCHSITARSRQIAAAAATARRTLHEDRNSTGSFTSLPSFSSSKTTRYTLSDLLSSTDLQQAGLAAARCRFLMDLSVQAGRVLTGNCCTSASWNTSELDGCTALVQTLVEGEPSPPQGMQNWSQSLPSDLQALDLAGMKLMGPLPETFAPNASQNLGALVLSGNSFSWTLPGAAWAELSQLWLLDLSSNYARMGVDYSEGFNNSFSGELPEVWNTSLKNLTFFWCNDGACDGLKGTIPASWSELCNLKHFSLKGHEGKSKLSGRLPWGWLYMRPVDWEKKFDPNKTYPCTPDVVIVGNEVQLPFEVCLLRGRDEIQSDKLFYSNNGTWAIIENRVNVRQAKQEDQYYPLEFTSSKLRLPPQNYICASDERFWYIAGVYTFIGLLVLCAVADLLRPRKASCFDCLDREGARAADSEVEQQHPAIATAMARSVPIAFVTSKVIIVVTDLASDAWATLTIRETPWVWGFLVMLLVPNILAALVLHLRLCHITCRQQKWHLLFVPATYKMYQWLYSKGGLALLHASLPILWPYWLLLEAPILFAAAFGRILKTGQQSRWAMQWLNVARFFSLLSFIMSCTESPFSAVVFTYFYAYGSTAQFPTAIGDGVFVFTVGTALLHMVMEFWRLVPFIKQRKFKARMWSLFIEVVVAVRVEGTAKVAVAAGANDGGEHLGGKSVNGEVQVTAEETEGAPAQGSMSPEEPRGSGSMEVNCAIDPVEQQGKDVVYYYPGEVPGLGGMSTSPDAAVVEEEGGAGGEGGGQVGSAGRGAGRGAPPRAGRGAPPRAGRVAGHVGVSVAASGVGKQ